MANKRMGMNLRFIPTEFGVDSEKVHFQDPTGNFYIRKTHIQHVIKKEGIPHTFVSCNYFAGFLLPQLAQPDLKTVDDLRTLNKVMYMRPPGNTYSMNELVALWEERIGKNLKNNFSMILIYSAFIKGDHMNFEIEPSGVEATQLYPLSMNISMAYCKFFHIYMFGHHNFLKNAFPNFWVFMITFCYEVCHAIADMP
ncbi:hypothetical protein AMTRI_Chr09g37560 [Amborella trichopoda]